MSLFFKFLRKKSLLIALPFLLMSGMCEEDPVEVEVADEFVNTFQVLDRGSDSEFKSSGKIDLEDLIAKYGDVLKSSNLESATLTLRNYDPSSINAYVKLEIGDVTVIDNNYTFINNQAVNLYLSSSIDLVKEIELGKYSFMVTISSDSLLNDNDFFVDITSTVKITVEAN